MISELLQTPELRVFEVRDYSIATNRGLRPSASILVRYRGTEVQATASGDGGYDAFMQALRSVESKLGFVVPKLLDYEVRIPPGGKTDAIVETTIQWEGGLITRGIDTDQLAAAIQATEHAINAVALHSNPHQNRTGTKRPRRNRRSKVTSVAR